jgi:hypothetical protein
MNGCSLLTYYVSPSKESCKSNLTVDIYQDNGASYLSNNTPNTYRSGCVTETHYENISRKFADWELSDQEVTNC